MKAITQGKIWKPATEELNLHLLFSSYNNYDFSIANKVKLFLKTVSKLHF